MRSAAAADFIDASHDPARVAWTDTSVAAAVTLLDDSTTTSLVEPSIARLTEGDTPARQGAFVLAELKVHRPGIVKQSDSAIETAVLQVLEHTGPDVAEQLGRAAHGIAKTRFRDVLRTMRNKNEQEPGEAATAFENALKS